MICARARFGGCFRSVLTAAVCVLVSATIARAAYFDIDKLNLAGSHTLWYNDANSNGEHDPGESYGLTTDPGWTNPVSATDNSCWLASACNMLGQAGVGNAESLYSHYSMWGVSYGSDTLTWDDGGWQHLVFDQWMSDYAEQVGSLSYTIHTAGYVANDGRYLWQNWDPYAEIGSMLDEGSQVGIGFRALYNGYHEGGHAITLQAVDNNGTWDEFYCTDSDRDGDWEGTGDYNRYDCIDGSFDSGGNTYYWWLSDFFANADEGGFYYPAGDTDYIIELAGESIPEPGSIALLMLLLPVLAMRRPRRHA